MAYSYLTGLFPDAAKHTSWAADVTSFRLDLFRRSDAVEAGTGDVHYFTAISTKDASFSEFARLSSQIIAFCRIRGVPVELAPKIALFRGKARWDPGAVWDALEDAAYDIHRSIGSGWVAAHESHVPELLNAEPRLMGAAKTHVTKVTNVSGNIVAFDLWSAADIEASTDPLLLAGPAANTLLVDVDSGLSALIASLHRSPSLITDLAPRRVEELVAELIHDRGYEVELTAKTKDGGRDVIAVRSGISELLPEQRYLIEVKHPRPHNPVRIEAVRALVGVGHIDHSTGLVLATTTRFTRDAKLLAANPSVRYRLSLRDFDDLFAWIKAYMAKRASDR